MYFLNRLSIITIAAILTTFSIVYSQDAGDGGLAVDGGSWDGSTWDGGVDGGTDWIPGCMDQWASNFNPSATQSDGSCTYTDCLAFEYSSMIQQSNPLYDCYMSAVYGGFTCEEILNMGGDLCSLIIECGFCEYESGCTDSQWECNNGDCIPAADLCDGSSEYGNASYGADCADGSDEGESCCPNGADGTNYSGTVCSELYDCADNFNGGAVVDECGECGGNGIDEGACDCDGNVLDECNECDGNGIDEGECDCDGNVLDCSGECGGDAAVDECGECGGNGIDEGECDCNGNVADCAGECGGNTAVDECGECGGNGINEGECDCDGNADDCAGVCGGGSAVDECDVCGGNGPQYQCWNNEMVCDSSDCSEQPQEFDIDLSLSFPTDEAQIEDYHNVNIEWSYEGTPNDSTYLSIQFSHNYGGGLKTVAEGIRVQSQSATVDLTTYANGEPICGTDQSSCVETIFGTIKIIASDISSGESSETVSESIIIGNPEGDIGINWLDEDSDMLVIDFGWITNQNIIILEDALLDLEDFTALKIADLQGVFDSSCSNADSSGAISLIQIPLTEDMQSELLWGMSYTLDCGADYCYENGGRIPGYNEGNQIHFYASDDTGYEIEVYPSTLDGQIPYFNNSSITITAFELSGNADGGTDGSNGECQDGYVDDCSGDVPES